MDVVIIESAIFSNIPTQIRITFRRMMKAIEDEAKLNTCFIYSFTQFEFEKSIRKHTYAVRSWTMRTMHVDHECGDFCLEAAIK